jgi:hypothetical protein
MFHQISFPGHRVAKKAVIATGALMALAAVSVAGAQAALISFVYEGTIAATTGDAAFDAFLGQIATFEFTVGPAATDDFPDDTRLGAYGDGAATISLTVGGYLATGINAFIGIRDKNISVGDQYRVEAQIFLEEISGADIGGMQLEIAELLIEKTAGGSSAITDDSVLLTQPNPTNFPVSFFSLFFSDGNGRTGSLEISHLTIASTPCPNPAFSRSSGSALSVSVMPGGAATPDRSQSRQIQTAVLTGCRFSFPLNTAVSSRHNVGVTHGTDEKLREGP